MIRLSILTFVLVCFASAKTGKPLSINDSGTRPPIYDNWATTHVKGAVAFIETTFPTDLLTEFQNVYQGAVSFKNTFESLSIVHFPLKVEDAGYYTVTYSDGSQIKADYVRQWEVLTSPGIRIDYEIVDRQWISPSTLQQ